MREIGDWEIELPLLAKQLHPVQVKSGDARSPEIRSADDTSCGPNALSNEFRSLFAAESQFFSLLWVSQLISLSSIHESISHFNEKPFVHTRKRESGFVSESRQSERSARRMDP